MSVPLAHIAPVTVSLPNGSTISSLGACSFSLPHIPHPLEAYIFADTELATSLVSISALCNAGCQATFTATAFSVTHDTNIVLQGPKLPQDSLWHVSLPSTPTSSPSPFLCNAAAVFGSDKNFVAFAHASMGSPPISTFLRAIRTGYLSTWPRLTPKIVAAHPPHSIATAKGHLTQTRQGLDSTTSTASATTAFSPEADPLLDIPDLPPSMEEANRVYIKQLHLSHEVSSDLTGKFPISSSSGSQYVLVSEMNGYIHCEPMASRSNSEYLRAFKNIVLFFTQLGHRPFYQKLDNECSTTLQTYLRNEKITLQFCPPGQHRSNRAERSIQTFKDHAIATFSTTAKDFPLTLWDKLLPQIELCINHLHPYKPNPAISAYAGLHGTSHDFRAHPIAPAGTKILIHEKPANRASWGAHGIPGYYLGPALQHYRCYLVWASNTQTTRVTDTVAWFPESVRMPDPSPFDLTLAAVADLTTALNALAKAHPTVTSSPQPLLSTSVTDQLTDLIRMYSPLPTAPEQRVPTVPDTLSPPLPVPEQRVSPPAPRAFPPEQRVSSLASVATDVPSPPPITDFPPNDHLPLLPHRIPSHPQPPALYTASATLNLSTDGSPLTFAKAKAGPDRVQWLIAEIAEFTRLFTSKTMSPIHLHQQPAHRRSDTTYYNPQTKQKVDATGATTYRIRGTAGGNKINYDGPTSAQTAAMEVFKLFLHSVISEHKFWMTIDIKDYYLNTPLSRSEYIRIPLKLIPDDIIASYSLTPYISNNSILFEIKKGMYGLPQAGLLAQQQLIPHLAKHGYHQTSTPCLFRHDSNGTDFTLVVDDFGIKYSNKAGAQHLIDTLSALYEIKVDWTGAKYIGFHIQFDTVNHSVALTMPGYIAKVLQRFAPTLTASAASPAVCQQPHYGKATQAPTIDTTAPLSPAAIKTLQEQVGCLLYYARGVDNTILPAVTHIASLQSTPTVAVAAAMTRLLQYCARYPNNALVFRACDMRLIIQSDASYLSRPKARSVAGGVFYLGNNNDPTHINGPCHAISTIIPVVVASVAEAEYAALFINGREGAHLRQVLHDIGYPQPTTDILCDNACAVGIADDSITPKQTKSIDMQFHWIRDRVRQQQFHVAWRKGDHNLADFFTKPLPVNTHQSLMPFLVRVPSASHTAHAKRRTAYLQANKQKVYS